MNSSNSLNDEDRHKKLSMFFHATGIPVEFIEGHTGKASSRLPQESYHFPVPSEGQTIQHKALKIIRKRDSDTYATLEDDYSQQYLAAGVWQNNELSGCFLAGPMQMNEMTYERITEILFKRHLPWEETKRVRDHYNAMPHINFLQYKYVGVLLQNLMYISNTIIENEADNDEESMKKETVARIIYHQSSSAETDHVLHHPYEWEEEFLEALKAGDRTVIKKLSAFDQLSIPDIGNGDPIRSYKNLLICAVTVSIRAVSSTGVDFEQLSRFADTFINRIESTNTAPELSKLYYDLYHHLFDMIDRHHETHYSNTVNACMRFIRQHLSEELTLDNIAATINLHPRYLAAVFKNETGMTIFTYIAKERVNAAKQMLLYSSEPIAKIANQIGYENQSYFTQIFKKYEGVTPKQYRLYH